MEEGHIGRTIKDGQVVIEPLLELEDEKEERVNDIGVRPRKKTRVIRYQVETIQPKQVTWADEFEQAISTNEPKQAPINLEEIIKAYPHAEKAEVKHQEISNGAEDFQDIAEVPEQYLKSADILSSLFGRQIALHLFSKLPTTRSQALKDLNLGMISFDFRKFNKDEVFLALFTLVWSCCADSDLEVNQAAVRFLFNLVQAYDDEEREISASAKAEIGRVCETIVETMLQKLGQGKIKESLRKIGNFEF